MASFRCGSCCLALLSVAVLGVSRAGAGTISTWNGGSGNWSNAGQWTPAVVPNNTGSQGYDVTINTGTVTLDTSPTINSLALNGGLSTGYDTHGLATALTVNGNAVVTGGIGAGGATPPQYGSFNPLFVGGNLANLGSMTMGAGLSVGGNLQNAGSLTMVGVQRNGVGFNVGGTLTNTGALDWGTTYSGGAAGTPTSLGALVNTGSVFMYGGTSVNLTAQPNGITNIPKGASWDVGGTFTAGSQSAFAHLNGIQGTLTLENTSRVGSAGSATANTGLFSVESTLGGAPAVVTVLGNFSNSGTVVLGYSAGDPSIRRGVAGPSTLNVKGSFINQANGTLTLGDATSSPSLNPAYGILNAQTLINYGNLTVPTSSPTTAGLLENSGTLNVFGDALGGKGTLAVGTLKLDAGSTTKVWNQGGIVSVGSGAVPIGFEGYYQSAVGVLDYGGGSLTIQDPASLDGTLDILLGDAYKPVGTEFSILYGGITGTFSNVEGLVFDDAQERYVLEYHANDVTLTVETNTAPEPGSLFLALLGFAGVVGIRQTRNRPFRARKAH